MKRSLLDLLHQGEKLNEKMVFRASESLKIEFEGICRKHNLNPGSVHRRLTEQFVIEYRKDGIKHLEKPFPILKPKAE